MKLGHNMFHRPPPSEDNAINEISLGIVFPKRSKLRPYIDSRWVISLTKKSVSPTFVTNGIHSLRRLNEVGVTSYWIERSYLAESNFKAAFDETQTIQPGDDSNDILHHTFEYMLTVILLVSLTVIVERLKSRKIRRHRRQHWLDTFFNRSRRSRFYSGQYLAPILSTTYSTSTRLSRFVYNSCCTSLGYV